AEQACRDADVGVTVHAFTVSPARFGPRRSIPPADWRHADNRTRQSCPVGRRPGCSPPARPHVNSGCCFDFGNAETNTGDNGNGHMDAVNLGTKCYFAPCTGSGPWVEADMENGLFSAGNGPNIANDGNVSNFVTAMLKHNGQTTYALKGGDATRSGGPGQPGTEAVQLCPGGPLLGRSMGIGSEARTPCSGRTAQ
ncbi:MAG: arabinofuranosidase catalytic domain-containing protein, partial [Trebonia sp.]